MQRFARQIARSSTQIHILCSTCITPKIGSRNIVFRHCNKTLVGIELNLEMNVDAALTFNLAAGAAVPIPTFWAEEVEGVKGSKKKKKI